MNQEKVVNIIEEKLGEMVRHICTQKGGVVVNGYSIGDETVCPTFYCNKNLIQSEEEVAEEIINAYNSYKRETKDLKDFIKEIKALGYKIKLDTNGTHPEVIEDLISENLLDYVAMDIKASPKKYNEVTGCDVNLELIKRTIKILKRSGIKHEFRTTYLPLLNEQDIGEITDTFIGKGSKYFLQQFRNRVTNDPAYGSLIPHNKSEVLAAVATAQAHIGLCGVRGI